MPVTKKPKIKDYTIYDFIAMTPENAGKVLFEECEKKKPNIEVIKNILEFSPLDVNLQDNGGETALMWASFHGHTEIVRMLLKRPEIDVNVQNEWGETALIDASANGHKEIVQLLLERPEIDVNLQDEDEDGDTALMMASDRGHTEIVQMLIDHLDIDELKKTVKFLLEK